VTAAISSTSEPSGDCCGQRKSLGDLDGFGGGGLRIPGGRLRIPGGRLRVPGGRLRVPGGELRDWRAAGVPISTSRVVPGKVRRRISRSPLAEALTTFLRCRRVTNSI
jgi:hypothetical protein